MGRGPRLQVVVGTNTQLITAVDVLTGNAWDSTGALGLVEQSEISAGAPVVEALGDTTYGDGGTRQDFDARGGSWWPVCRPTQQHTLPKDGFAIDLMAGNRAIAFKLFEPDRDPKCHRQPKNSTARRLEFWHFAVFAPEIDGDRNRKWLM